MKQKHRRLCLGAAVMLPGTALFLLWYFGLLVPNAPSRGRYPVRGVDVSAYQGEIDWEVLAGQGIRFAFIKATEGSSFTDERFAENYPAARAAGLAVGGYHFFSYDSPAGTQADHFIATVPRDEDALPPVIDIEFYGGYFRTPADAGAVREELTLLIGRLTEHYGRPPILYATRRAYDLYLAGGFDACPVWIREVYFAPSLPDGRTPAFWQYSDRCRLPGYKGEEARIDLDVFCGSEEGFLAFLQGG